jgi:hypothetical protein
VAGLNKSELEHISILMRRKEFLEGRLDRVRNPESYDRREYSALVWALERLNERSRADREGIESSLRRELAGMGR